MEATREGCVAAANAIVAPELFCFGIPDYIQQGSQSVT
jgi:hypothetical protein